MALEKTPICKFGDRAYDFNLKSVDEKNYKLKDIIGKKGTLIMFICNHCPYVKSIIRDLIFTTNKLKNYDIGSVAIMPNDTINYPDDSYENMKKFANQNNFRFPYLIDQTQQVAKNFGAVCTPDFFGYNSKLELQYRGRLREMQNLNPVKNSTNELMRAMIKISKTEEGPKKQFPSMGCNIKWK